MHIHNVYLINFFSILITHLRPESPKIDVKKIILSGQKLKKTQENAENIPDLAWPVLHWGAQWQNCST